MNIKLHNRTYSDGNYKIIFLFSINICTFAIMKNLSENILILFLLFFLVSCQQEKVLQNKKQLTVTIIPQKYIVTAITGNTYEVLAMLPPGSNHETYEPTPGDMKKIETSAIYFSLDALDFEKVWMERFQSSNPNMKVINTSKGIEMLSGHIHDHDEHEHAHTSNGIDPHIWLSPACMKIQAQNICEALSAEDSLNADYFKQNLKKFEILADSIDRIVRETLAGSKGKSILIFHPALGYFARDYELNQISIEQEGKEPSPSYLAELIKTAKERGIKSIFVSKEFDTRNAEAIASEINGKIIVFDPMAENWAENIIHLSNLIAEN